MLLSITNNIESLCIFLLAIGGMQLCNVDNDHAHLYALSLLGVTVLFVPKTFRYWELIEVWSVRPLVVSFRGLFVPNTIRSQRMLTLKKLTLIHEKKRFSR